MRICSTNATRLAKQHTESQPGEPLFDHFDREPVVSQRIGMLWGPGTALALGVDGCHCLSSLVGQRQPEVPVDICHRTQRIGNQVVVVHVVELGRIIFGPCGIEPLHPRDQVSIASAPIWAPTNFVDHPSVVCCASEHIDAMIVSTGR